MVSSTALSPAACDLVESSGSPLVLVGSSERPPVTPPDKEICLGDMGTCVAKKNRGIYSGVFVWLIQAGLRVVHFFKAHPISEMAFKIL